MANIINITFSLIRDIDVKYIGILMMSIPFENIIKGSKILTPGFSLFL